MRHLFLRLLFFSSYLHVTIRYQVSAWCPVGGSRRWHSRRGSASDPLCRGVNGDSSSSSSRFEAFVSQSSSFTTLLKSSLSSSSLSSTTLSYEGRIPSPQDFRCGFCTIVGSPNAGKSTLLNALLQEHVSIATARPQTTRHAILGLLTTNRTQTCLLDTPGVIEQPAYQLQSKMMEAVTSTLRDTDALLVVVDAVANKETGLPGADDPIWQRVQKLHQFKPTIVAINKIDALPKASLEADLAHAIQQWRTLLPQAVAIIPVAASHHEHPGVHLLRNILTCAPKEELDAATRAMGRPIPGMFPQQAILPPPLQDFLPLSPPLYDPQLLTDRPERFLASEMIRQALFENLEQELPYCTEVQIDSFSENDPALIRIEARVIVERESQKIIVIGKKGNIIKSVGVAARRRLEDFFQTKIFLQLRVVVDQDWRTKEDRLQRYGYGPS